VSYLLLPYSLALDLLSLFSQIIDVDASTLYALAPYCGQRESWKQNHVTDAANKT